MLFGEVNKRLLNKIEFKLPKDPPENSLVLKKGKGNCKLYMGCAKWGRPEWVGKIYPYGAKEKDFLGYYGQHYNAIELNATHYKVYPGETLKQWANKVYNDDFRFCPKAYRGMSFLKNTPNKDRLTKDVISHLRAFGKQLGPVYITHDEKVKWNEQGETDFFNYLDSLPRDVDFFIEERWEGFFADKALMKRYYTKLRAAGVGAIITDTAGRRDALHMQLTTPKAFIRFVGNSLHETDYLRIDIWANRIKQWMDAGIEEIYFFMHMHDEGKSPELSRYTVQQFNKKCKTHLKEIKFVPAK